MLVHIDPSAGWTVLPTSSRILCQYARLIDLLSTVLKYLQALGRCYNYSLLVGPSLPHPSRCLRLVDSRLLSAVVCQLQAVDRWCCEKYWTAVAQSRVARCQERLGAVRGIPFQRVCLDFGQCLFLLIPH